MRDVMMYQKVLTAATLALSGQAGLTDEYGRPACPISRSNHLATVLSATLGILLLTVLVVAAGGCQSSEAAETPMTPVAQTLTPLLLSVRQAPVPFFGSDGHVHLTYELWLTNLSSAPARIENVQISGDGNLLQTLDADDVAARLQPAGFRVSSGTMAASTQALLFIDVILPDGAPVPDHLSHTVKARIKAAPPGHQDVTATLGGTAVNHRRVLVIGPPLRGNNYISADSCCDSARHRRAALPVNGTVWLAQRFAVDWEELNDQNRIYAGPKAALSSYTIWGKPVLAVADGTVVTAINNECDQPPGSFPPGLTIEQADGNAVIVDLGHRNYAVYAHMQQGSVRVTVGQRVTRGEIIGLVGNSGNTLAPHLHFQLMSAPESLASNGLPYEIDSYQITGISPGTAAFDEAEANGTPLAVTPVSPPRQVTAALPLDQLIISFGP